MKTLMDPAEAIITKLRIIAQDPTLMSRESMAATCNEAADLLEALAEEEKAAAPAAASPRMGELTA